MANTAETRIYAEWRVPAAVVGWWKATRPGLEPGMREPKSLVLPLHHRVVSSPASTAYGFSAVFTTSAGRTFDPAIVGEGTHLERLTEPAKSERVTSQREGKGMGRRIIVQENPKSARVARTGVFIPLPSHSLAQSPCHVLLGLLRRYSPPKFEDKRLTQRPPRTLRIRPLRSRRPLRFNPLPLLERSIAGENSSAGAPATASSPARNRAKPGRSAHCRANRRGCPA